MLLTIKNINNQHTIFFKNLPPQEQNPFSSNMRCSHNLFFISAYFNQNYIIQDVVGIIESAQMDYEIRLNYNYLYYQKSLNENYSCNTRISNGHFNAAAHSPCHILTLFCPFFFYLKLCIFLMDLWLDGGNCGLHITSCYSCHLRKKYIRYIGIYPVILYGEENMYQKLQYSLAANSLSILPTMSFIMQFQ